MLKETGLEGLFRSKGKKTIDKPGDKSRDVNIYHAARQTSKKPRMAQISTNVSILG